MSRHDFKVRDRIKVLVGCYRDGTGRMEVIAATDVPKCIGCKVTMIDDDGKTTGTFVWFDPDKNEIEKVEEA